MRSLDGPSVRGIAIADGFAQLVAHVFAHVKLERAGNLYDRRYVAWAREHLAADATATVEHDAALIGGHWRADARLDVLHGMFELHGDLDAFRKTAARPLAQLDAPAFAPLQEETIAPIAELLHTTLALVAEDFECALGRLAPQLERACEQLEPLVARLAAVVPGLERARIELVWALGMHGRAFRNRILVGAPASWCGCSPARQAVLAAHEYTVRTSDADDYVGSEWDALTKLSRQMQRIEDVALRAAHANWLAELDLDDLLRGVVERGWLSHDDAWSLLDDRPSRAHRLAG